LLPLPESTTLPAAGALGRRSPRLDGVFLADAAREPARAVRDASMMLLAALGLPLWLLVSWPARFSFQLRLLATTSWAVAALVAVVAVARERWWGRVRTRRIEALGPLPRLRGEGARGGACRTPAEEED